MEPQTPLLNTIFFRCWIDLYKDISCKQEAVFGSERVHLLYSKRNMWLLEVRNSLGCSYIRLTGTDQCVVRGCWHWAGGSCLVLGPATIFPPQRAVDLLKCPSGIQHPVIPLDFCSNWGGLVSLVSKRGPSKASHCALASLSAASTCFPSATF